MMHCDNSVGTQRQPRGILVYPSPREAVVGLSSFGLVSGMVRARSRRKDAVLAARFGTRFAECAGRPPAIVPRVRWHDS